MRATVNARCVGRATGTAAVLLAGATGTRRATAHALISLRCEQHERLDGSPDQVRRRVEELELIRRHVVAALGRRRPDGRRPRSATSSTTARCSILLEAEQLGIIDEVDDRPE